MPAALDVDREQVRMLVLSVGAREAARQMNLDENTVLQWSARYGWIRNAQAAAVEAAKAVPPSMRKQAVSGVISAADALQNVLKDGALRTRVGLTKYATKMAEQAAEAGTIEEAPLYKAVADIHAKMHPEQQQSSPGVVVNMAILSSQPDCPVLDISSEVVPSPELLHPSPEPG